MKLKSGEYEDVIESADGSFYLELVDHCTGPDFHCKKVRDEIIRRVNAHEALVEFAQRVCILVSDQSLILSLQDTARAALALAEKGEGTQ